MASVDIMASVATQDFENLFVEVWTCEHCNKADYCSDNVYYSSEVSECPVCGTSCIGRLNNWKVILSQFTALEKIFSRQLYKFEVLNKTSIKLGFNSCKDSSDVREFLIRRACHVRIKQVENKLTETTTKLQDAEKKLAELPHHTTQCQENVPQVQVVSLDELLREHAGQLKNYFSQLETNIAALKTRNADLAGVKLQQEIRHSEEVSVLKANARQCSYWKALSSAWEEKFKALEKDTGALEVRCIDLENKNTGLKTKSEDLEAKANTLEAKCGDLEAKANTLEAKCGDLEEESASWKIKSEALEAKSNVLEAKSNALEAKFATLEAECAYWKAKAETLEQQKKDVGQFIKLAERVKLLEDKIQSDAGSLPVAVPTLVIKEVGNKKRREVFEEELFTLKRRNV